MLSNFIKNTKLQLFTPGFIYIVNMDTRKCEIVN